MVKAVQDLYYDQAYLVALAGNAKEVNKLSTQMKEAYDAIANKETEGNLRRFLIVLQRIQGKEVNKDVPINELSDLIITVPWSKRIVWRKILGILVGVITVVASIVQIMSFFR